MRNMLTITGLGRIVRGTPTQIERKGLFVLKNGLQGQQALSARRRDALARALSHGEHDVPVRLPARVTTLDGAAIERSLELLGKLTSRVSSWGATGERFTLTVDHMGQVTSARVRVMVADVEDAWERRGGLFVSRFQVQFLAADPRKYGATATLPGSGTSTSVPVFHRGNFPAAPVIEIPSAPSSYTITSPAGTFTVSGAAAGGTHRIDMRTGRVTRNGVWMQGVGRGPVWAVPEGAVWTHTLSAPGRVLIADTFV